MQKYFLIILLAVVFVSCDSSFFFEENKPVDTKGWTRAENQVFDVDVTDTAKFYDFYINIRNTENYPYSNIFFFVETTFPGNERAIDTIECRLATPDGRWTGKGGDIKDNQFLFKRKVLFPFSGNYKFEIRQGMRDSALVGIKDIGLKISYSN